MRTGQSRLQQVLRSAPISGRKRDKYAAAIFTGLLAKITWMGIVVHPEAGTEW